MAVAAASPAITAPTVINQRPRSIPSSRRITNTATKTMTIPVSSSSIAGPSLTYPGQSHCVGRSSAAIDLSRCSPGLVLPSSAAVEPAAPSSRGLVASTLTTVRRDRDERLPGQPVVDPLLASGPDPLVDRLGPEVVRSGLPGQPSRTPAGGLSPAFADEPIGQAPATGVLGDEQVVHDADPRRAGS